MSRNAVKTKIVFGHQVQLSWRRHIKRQFPNLRSQKRRLQMALARQALQQALHLEGKAFCHDDICIEDHSHLASDPSIKVSLTHTDQVGACAYSLSDSIKGVGIDIEWKSRTLSSGLEKYFQNPDDRGAQGISLWCLKEAAFKALSGNTDHPPNSLNQLIIQGQEFRAPCGLSGEVHLLDTCGPELSLAVAWI